MIHSGSGIGFPASGLSNDAPELVGDPVVPRQLTYSAALVGFGNVAQHAHLPWYRSAVSVDLCAVVEPTAGGRATARTALPGVAMYASLDDLLRERRPHFVDITAPPATHAELILKALDLGVSVICEKPFVTSIQDLDAIRCACQRTGAVVAACHNWRFAPPIERAIEYVLRGSIGTPTAFRFIAERRAPAAGVAHWKPEWRQSRGNGGGIIGDLGYHGIYLASSVFQRRPLSVTARVARRGGVDIVARVGIDYGIGQADMDLSWLSDKRRTVLEIDGAAGGVVVSDSGMEIVERGSVVHREAFEPMTGDSWHAGWTGRVLDSFVALLQHRNGAIEWQDIESTVSAMVAAQNCAAHDPALFPAIGTSTR